MHDNGTVAKAPDGRREWTAPRLERLDVGMTAKVSNATETYPEELFGPLS